MSYNPIRDIKEDLRERIIRTINSLIEQGRIPNCKLPEFVIEKPREKGHGDFATNLAMVMAREAKMKPRDLAEMLVADFQTGMVPIKVIEIAGPGFINFTLSDDWLYQVPHLVWELQDQYGRGDDQGKKVQVEFVSANPTGNLHMGNARGGALGDSLANLLALAGYQVEREYYINDAGNQVELFGASLEARYLEELGQEWLFPEGGYAGEDVRDTVLHYIDLEGRGLLALTPDERRAKLVKYALKEKVDYIKTTLSGFGINYDVWFSEKSLHESGKVAAVVAKLREQGFIYEKEGAIWLKTTEFGDEKDEVLVRANGIPTYFAADIAYHLDKYERGFDLVINIWGADHHGHVARMKGAMQALGIAPERLEVILMQLVRLYSDGELVRMSKRTGTLITLDELVEEVGRDAARFFFIMRSADSHLDFDLELAKKKSQENPVYYVQYAHARICSMLRQAEENGVPLLAPDKVQVEVLATEEERDLLRQLAHFPEEIELAARILGPHRIPHYLMELAGMLHSFYNQHRVFSEDQEISQARLLLMYLVKVTIKNALTVIGVTAPERM
ncbi:MAG: arginine--tRNA ligase [Methylocystaceae bacterium]